ncbi:hypothetical protein ACQ4PT_042425 [Festuca glaucescens]
MAESDGDSPTRACAGEATAERGKDASHGDSPTRACAGEPAGEGVMEEPHRGARAAKGTAAAAGPGRPADETHDVSEAEDLGGGATGEFSAELPEDLIHMILSKLPPCPTEHWAFRCLNQRWHSAVNSLFENMHPLLPSLILPSSGDPIFHSTVSCQWHQANLPEAAEDCLWKKLYLPKDVREHGKLCGSSEGGWFVLISEEIRNFNLEAAAVSSSPSLPGYKVAAFGKSSTSLLVIQRPQMKHWGNVPFRIPTDDSLVDVIYYKSQFWFLTAEERVGKLVEEFDWEGNLRTSWIELDVRERESYVSDAELAEKTNNLITKRYFVVSKDDLYMVVRVLSPTAEIRVFRLQLNDLEEECDSSSDSYEFQSEHLYYTW